MTDQPLEPIQEEAIPPNAPLAEPVVNTRRDIVLWLALLPVILGLLFLCGQVALLFSLRQSAADTRSRLETSYGAWIYDLIPPINIPQLIEDIQQDLRAEGIVEEPAPVVTGVFWVPPTATSASVAAATSTQVPFIPSETLPPPPPPPTATNEPPVTRPTNTAPPSATFTTAPTRTNTFPPPPTRTNTAPPPQPTRTPTRTAVPPTLTPPPTATRTNTPPPTAPPPTVAPQPPYEPVSPIAENEGASVPDGNGGCKAFFGYRNNNLYPVNIPLGPRNRVNIENSSAPPTGFAVGRIAGAFQISWSGGGSVIWELDGRRAEVGWCNP